ncbi:MAG: HigA family addiction module antitoxin [Methanosarcinaceae archaeon]|nr:HigA family addiction module antitoxin [Methanosarcinaceae archaeon]
MITKRKPTHPGVVLREDVLVPLGLTVTEAAKDLGITRKTLSEFINEKSSLSPDMAVRISKATNTTSESWMKMQIKLDLWKAENRKTKVIPFPKLDSENLNLIET